MRHKLLLAFVLSILCYSLRGDEKDYASRPAAQSDAVANPRQQDAIAELLAAIKGLESRVSAIEHLQRQKPFSNSLPWLTPPDYSAPTVSAPVLSDRSFTPPNVDPLINPYRGGNAGSAPIHALPVYPGTSAEPDARTPDGPSEPRIARESKTWQRLKIDGKLFFLVPATDVQE